MEYNEPLHISIHILLYSISYFKVFEWLCLFLTFGCQVLSIWGTTRLLRDVGTPWGVLRDGFGAMGRMGHGSKVLGALGPKGGKKMPKLRQLDLSMSLGLDDSW